MVNRCPVVVTQGSLFPTARRPGASKTTSRASGFGQIFFLISYKQIKEFQSSWSRASDDFEKRRALLPKCLSIYVWALLIMLYWMNLCDVLTMNTCWVAQSRHDIVHG